MFNHRMRDHIQATDPDHYQRMRRDRPVVFMIRAAKARAKKYGVEYSLPDGYLEMPPVCPCCGVKFKPGNHGYSPEAPSLDRLTNALGYIPGNVAIICNRCNTTKGDASVKDLRCIADWLEHATNPLNVPASSRPSDLGSRFQEGLWLTF